MKRINNYLYYKPITYDNLLECYYDIRKTCKNKSKLLKYEVNLQTNIYNLYMSLLNETSKPLKFNIFKIYEPKVRVVMSQEINDKIVNHFVTRYYLIPLLEKKLIDQNIATRKNKGISYGDKLLKNYLNTLNLKSDKIYALKLDISKYFYSIDKNILINLLKKDILDNKIINLLSLMLNETNMSYINYEINKLNSHKDNKLPLYLNNCGLSLGAVSSQFLAIYYLNKLHHYIKEDLHCKFFIVYMDDYLILDNNKDLLLFIWQKIKKKIMDFNLVLNKKSNIYDLKDGINFLGAEYRIVNHKLKITPYKKTKNKIANRLKYLYKHNRIKYYRSLASYNGYYLRFMINIGDINMSIKEKYDDLCERYPDTLIIIRDKRFYKCFDDSALIIHYIMRYKYNDLDKLVVFGVNAYNNVIDNLNHFQISYLMYEEKEIYINGHNNNYHNFVTMANKAYEDEMIINKLNVLFNKVIHNNFDKIGKIEKMLIDLK